MALREFLGRAQTTAQQWTYTITDATNANTHIFTATDLNTNATEADTYVIGSGETTTTVATAIVAMFTASANPLMQAISASSTAAVVTLTAKYPGVPFSLARTGTSTATKTVIATSSGPYDFGCAANFAGNVVPAGADDVFFSGAATVRYGLYNAGTTYAKLSTGADFTGSIGTPGVPFQGAATDLDVFGAGQSHWDLGSSAITPYVWGTSSLAPLGAPAVTIKGSALTNVTIGKDVQGTVGIAPYQGQTSTVTLIKQYGGRLLAGSGLTLTNLQLSRGTATIYCAASGTIDALGGTLLIEGSGAVVTLNVYDAIVTSNTTGTITTASTKGAGTLDFTQSRAARTVTTMNIAGITRYDAAVMTFTTSNVYNANGNQATYVPPQS